ncbi:MAG TPA: hypothetical protein VG297_13130 [Bryobacteraceae bacterium]|jgi:hypothetical protein|nr:hypothetical protein [Bryobacteraceae bacterium]
MKHIGQTALDSIEPLLADLRKIEGLTERKRGLFYRKSAAFLHFHEDPAGIFADIRSGGEWLRMAVNTPVERGKLLRAARAAFSL